MSGARLAESAWQDCKFGLRQLRRNPGFAVAGIAILGLGIAATTAVFSLAYGVLLRDLPYERPDRLVTIWGSLPKSGLPKAYAGAADYFDFRRDQQVFEELALTIAMGNFNLTGEGEPERLRGARTTASLFQTLRAKPLMGRVYTEEEQLDPAKAARVAVLSYGLWQRRFAGDPEIVGRLKDGVTIERARAHLESLAAKLGRDYPNTNRNVGVVVGPMLSELTETISRSVWVLVAAVGMLFLIGCVNLANLLLARAANRSRELSVRASLGATRSRLARQFFAETVPLALAGIGSGFLGAHVLLRMLIPWLPAGMPRVEEISPHAPVLVFTALLSGGAAFLVAIAPAIQVGANLERGPAARNSLRDALMIAEIAGTVLLLVTSGLLMRSFSNLTQVNPGFQPDRALSLQLSVSRAKYHDENGVARYLGRLIEQLRAIPGVDAVGLVNRLPMSGQKQASSILFEHEPEMRGLIDSRSVNGDYFRSLGIPLLAGRTFDDRDSRDHTPGGIIDERTGREYFKGLDPIGKRFRVNAPGERWVQVVGVAGHLRHDGLDSDPRPQVYWPYQQITPERMAFVIRGVSANLA